MQSSNKKTSIGGQALIEGIMMRGPVKTAMAVRKADQSIDLEIWDTYKNGKAPAYKKWPFVRGVFNMVESLTQGFKCMMQSAEKAGIEEEPSRFESWLSDKLGTGINSIISTLAVVMGVGLALLLFVVLPTGATWLLQHFVALTPFLFTIIEGAVKIAIFILYLFLCSRSKDVARVFQFHGAEHKTIACYEAGQPLTIENCRKHTRFHPRCGTSFLLIVLVVSILIFSVVTIQNPLLRMVLKLAVLPLVIGIAYEFIKLAGRYDNWLTRGISAPGLWLQNLTTNEPDDSQLEIAIAAMEAVIPEDTKDDQW